MSLSILISERAQIEKEILSLSKKIADCNKKSANALKKENSVSSSIKPSTSPSMIHLKLRQIESCKRDRASADAKAAEYSQKLARLQGNLNSKNRQIQKAQIEEQQKAQKSLQDMYDGCITDLERKFSRTLLTPMAIRGIMPSDKRGNYDVFISHASEDKKEFVDELVSELRALGVNVWYDTSEVKWGHSIRERIDDGLKKSLYGIVILSPDYIAEHKYWTKAELDGLFQKDSVQSNRLLPIWYKLSYEDVASYSPILASRKGIEAKYFTPAGIAYEFKKLLDEMKQKSVLS